MKHNMLSQLLNFCPQIFVQKCANDIKRGKPCGRVGEQRLTQPQLNYHSDKYRFMQCTMCTKRVYSDKELS